jgi:phosphatidylglycerophosphatase A
MRRLLLYAFGTFLGSGFSPIAPATAASFVVAILWWACAPVRLPVQIALLIVVTALGVPAATALERRHGHDPKLVVCDEVAGMIVTYMGLWVVGFRACMAGFLWFRVFDVIKPPPVRQLERLPRGWGIMADDLLAGVYAHVALLLTLRWTGW